MFNTYYMGQNNECARVNVLVDEKKAPTDESIRMLMEMEKKAFENLIGRFDVNDNILKGSVFVFRDVFTQSYKIVSRFNLNGKEFRIENQIFESQFAQEDARKLLYENIAKEIFLKLISSAEMIN
jgi:hypothetical protein